MNTNNIPISQNLNSHNLDSDDKNREMVVSSSLEPSSVLFVKNENIPQMVLKNGVRSKRPRLNRERSKKFIEVLRQSFPDLSFALKSFALTKPNFQRIMELNPKFRDEVYSVLDEKLDTVEVAMYKRALMPGGFMDRITILRRYRPEWRDRQANAPTVFITVDEAQERLGKMRIVQAKMVDEVNTPVASQLERKKPTGVPSENPAP